MAETSFSLRLKELRQEKGVSQKELAEYLNIVQGTVSAWEVNHAAPNIETLIDLADYFDVSVDYLVAASDIKNPFSPYNKELAQTIESLELMQKFVVAELAEYYAKSPRESLFNDLLILAYDQDFMYVGGSPLSKTRFSRIVPLGISLQNVAAVEKQKILEEARRQNPGLAKSEDIEESKRNGLMEALKLIHDDWEKCESKEKSKIIDPVLSEICRKISDTIINGTKDK